MERLGLKNYQGPTFRLVRQIDWEELVRTRRWGARKEPLLVKGAVKAWPAWERWSFEKLAQLRKPDGSEVIFRFQNGLVEQGVTRPPLDLAISPYIRDLGERAARETREEGGLLPVDRYLRLDREGTFHLDWSHMETFKPDRVYLAQWNILTDFPELRKDFAIRKLWPGWRHTWEFVFIGPSKTITGVHYDFPNNWFCQVRGTKEVILFPSDQRRFMCKSKKYDWGATLSDIDISRLSELPREREAFAQAQGLYARVEAGDALFIPKETWHSVVALTPSISLGVFGLTPWEVISGGGPSEFRSLLHKLRLYRWGNCTCHKMTASSVPDPT
jgi:lysine-specific demethylase 8